MANIDSILFLEKVVGLRRTGRIWVGAARTALARALEHEWNLGSTMGLTVPAAWSLTNRCFKIGENGRKGKAVADDIVRIDSVFKEIQALFKEIDLGKPYFQLSPSGHSMDNAYTYPGHWKFRNPKDGIWFVESNLKNRNSEFIVDAMIHECAHYCGPLGAKAVDHAKVRGKAAYGQLALGLTRSQALVNASSYAWLAYLARLPEDQWLTNMG